MAAQLCGFSYSEELSGFANALKMVGKLVSGSGIITFVLSENIMWFKKIIVNQLQSDWLDL